MELYYLSKTNMNDDIISPRVPSNYFTKNKLTAIQEGRKVLDVITDDISITKSYGVTVNGRYDALVDVNGMRARGRSEILILKGDKVYLSKSKHGLSENYNIPGGGWDQDEDHAIAAIREAEEETRLKTKNVKYASRYLLIYDDIQGWVKKNIPKEYQWKAYYTEVYVGEYAGKYTGYIADADKDDIIKTGKFYDIKDVFDELHPIHQAAIVYYLASNKNNSSILSQENSVFSEAQNTSSGKGGIRYINYRSEEAHKYIESNLFLRTTYSNRSEEYNGEIAVHGDEVVGYIFIGDKTDKGFINSLYVDKKYRKQGIASKLLKDAIHKYGGYDLTVSKNNKTAIDMYTKRGFIEDSSRTKGSMIYMKLDSAKNESIIVNEGVSEFIIGVMLLSAIAPKLVSLDKANKEMSAKLKDNTKAEFYVSEEKDGKPITTGYSEPEYAVLEYAYKNGIHEGESKTIFADDSTKKVLDNKIYIYSKSKALTRMVKSGSFESVCKSYGIKIKEIDKSHAKERADAVKKALSELRSKLPNIIKSKGKFPTSNNERYKEEYDDFINMVSNSLVLFYASLWNIDKEARTHAKEGLHYDTIWKPLEDCLAEINKSLPKGYKVDYDNGDWDDILIDIRTTSIHESTILEEKRSEIPASEFGVPGKRKFPLTDAKHVKSAIKFFNYVDEDDEAELARNIKRKAKEYGVVIRCGKKNRLSKYINKEYINEFIAKESMCDSMYAVCNGNIKQHISQGDHIISATDSYPFTKKEKKKKDPVDGHISVYIGDGEKMTVNESTSKVPVYIIAYDYTSIFAGILKAATHSHFNHIAIALSPDLNKAYTFARSVNGDNSRKGFAIEPLSQMIKEHGDFLIKVNAVYVTEGQYKEIKECIDYYIKHKDDTSYNYGNLVKAAFRVGVDNDKLDDDSMNCSIFVDYILKKSGVDITDNPNSNLVFPEQLANADNGNDNVVTVYYGKASGYNKKKIGKMKYIGENDDAFFEDIMKQFEDLDMEPIPTDIFHEREDQG